MEIREQLKVAESRHSLSSQHQKYGEKVMATHSRRKILQITVTTAVGSSFAPLWAVAQYGRADLVILGGTATFEV